MKPISPNILKTRPRHRARKKKVTKHIEVQDRERFGHLVTRARWSKSAGRQEREYLCTCDCGQTLHLPYTLLLQRRKDKLGCCLPGCTSSPVALAVWSDPDASLLYQWRQARAASPNHLCAEWGGYAYDGVAPDPDGYEHFLKMIWPLIDVNSGCWWVHRVDEYLPLYDLNICLKEYPDTGIFNPKLINVDLSGSSYPLNELAQVYKIDEKLILKMWSEITNDADFIEWVVAEAHKGDHCDEQTDS